MNRGRRPRFEQMFNHLSTTHRAASFSTRFFKIKNIYKLILKIRNNKTNCEQVFKLFRRSKNTESNITNSCGGTNFPPSIQTSCKISRLCKTIMFANFQTWSFSQLFGPISSSVNRFSLPDQNQKLKKKKKKKKQCKGLLYTSS